MKLFSLIGAILLAVSCNTVCFTTYNVGVFTKSGENLMSSVSSIIGEIGADVVCLNELDSCTTRTGGRFQIADLSDMLGGWNYHFTRAIPHAGGSYGVGIVSRPSLRPVDTWGMTLEKGLGAEQRALSVVEFKRFVLATAHLDHTSDQARIEQARIVTDTLSKRYGSEKKLVVFCGDMNATPGSETVRYLEEFWNIVSGTDFTFSSDNPRVCIDYIMVLNNGVRYKLVSSSVGRSFDSVDVTLASDHLPVTSILKF